MKRQNRDNGRGLVLTILTAGLLAVPPVAGASAEEREAINLSALVEQEVEVTTPDGNREIQRIAAKTVVPGDEVIYTLIYRNDGSDPAENVVITNPIPEHMVYTGTDDSGETSHLTFSIDGGEVYDTPENLEIVDADGHKRRAKPTDYTHVRWEFVHPLDPGAQGSVSFRAQLQ